MHEALSQESVRLKRICFASTHNVVPEEQEIKAQVLLELTFSLVNQCANSEMKELRLKKG